MPDFALQNHPSYQYCVVQMDYLIQLDLEEVPASVEIEAVAQLVVAVAENQYMLVLFVS